MRLSLFMKSHDTQTYNRVICGEGKSGLEDRGMSAQTGEGVDAFKGNLSALIAKGNLVRSVRLKASDGAALAWIHARGTINSQIVDDDLVTVEASLSRQLWGQFDKQFDQIEA